MNHTIFAIDANVLITWIKAANGSDTKARLDYFLSEVSSRQGRIIIPTPALAEFLVKIDQAAPWFDVLDRRRVIHVAPFGRREALEHALLTGQGARRSSNRQAQTAARQVVKFDRQIVAIAKVAGAEVLVSGDADVRRLAGECGMVAMTIDNLDLPAEVKQGRLSLETTAPSAAPLAGSQ